MNLKKVNALKLPSEVEGFIRSLHFDGVEGVEVSAEVRKLTQEHYHVQFDFTLEQAVSVDDWQVNLVPSFEPTFHWSPHLTPTDSHIVSQHAFRSPALIVANEQRQVKVIPDLDLLSVSPVKWYMDINAIKNELTIGLSEYKVVDHVLFEREKGMVFPEGTFSFGFYLFLETDQAELNNPFRSVLRFLWKNHGKPLYDAGEPTKEPLKTYVDHTYEWAFNRWDAVYQEFELDGKTVGAPAFIVNVTQSPNFKGPVTEREMRSIWNQAWFSSIRSASGLYRYGKAFGRDDLVEKAKLAKELALSAPMTDGIFPAVINTEMEVIEVDGEWVHRSKGWETARWGNSNRNPFVTWGDVNDAPYHILDMSFTAYYLLCWYDELEKDERLLEYAEDYAKSLLNIQYSNGFFPAWLDLETLKPLDFLNDSPETSMSVTFLLKLYELTGNKEYKEAALKAIDAVIRYIIPTGQWEDFETYWSCSRYGSNNLVGKKILRNNMYKQCNFSMFWTAEALFECYRITKDKRYLRYGQRTLDEMLMTQASWQPPYMYVNVLGGFGVMNSDAEWNDARGSLFAEIILQYGELLGMPEYYERGISALKSSFVMMYCPENPRTKVQWEKTWPFFGPEDYGFTMENYGHNGRTSPEGLGMGEFTIYDWGNGAAAEAYNRILDKFGEIERFIK